MMVYRQMPAIWDPAFRKEFYRRWGTESAIVCARSRKAEYPRYKHLLSVKAVFDGTEDYFLDRRRVSVDTQTFLIINNDRSYGSLIESLQPVHSFAVFFDQALVSRSFATLRHTAEALLDDPERLDANGPQFSERLYRHDRLVSPVFRHIRRQVDVGIEDDLWLEEQLSFLLTRMLRLEFDVRKQQERVLGLRQSTRREIERRVALAVDFICTHFRERLTLQQIASAAQLSPFYLLRQFQAVHGCSPGAYVRRRRCLEAAHLLQHSTWTMAVIAEHVGFGNRSSLFRQIKTELGVEPRNLRPSEHD